MSGIIGTLGIEFLRRVVAEIVNFSGHHYIPEQLPPTHHQYGLRFIAGAHQFDMADAQGSCQFKDSYDGGIPFSLLQAAYVLLAIARDFRKLLLGQVLLLPDPSDVVTNQFAHVHTQESANYTL